MGIVDNGLRLSAHGVCCAAILWLSDAETESM